MLRFQQDNFFISTLIKYSKLLSDLTHMSMLLQSSITKALSCMSFMTDQGECIDLSRRYRFYFPRAILVPSYSTRNHKSHSSFISKSKNVSVSSPINAGLASSFICIEGGHQTS